MTKKAHTHSYESTSGVEIWNYWGPHLKYSLRIDNKKKKKTLLIHKDGEEFELTGREVNELAKIF
jgi:hypothetical protein